MLSSDAYRCRVCGLHLDDPPWGFDGRTPLYEHCPCCGVEFGYQDATPIGAKRFREAWLAGGAEWDEPDRKPSDWSPIEQLEHVPAEFR
jgi:hypothetical protein